MLLKSKSFSNLSCSIVQVSQLSDLPESGNLLSVPPKNFSALRSTVQWLLCSDTEVLASSVRSQYRKHAVNFPIALSFPWLFQERPHLWPTSVWALVLELSLRLRSLRLLQTQGPLRSFVRKQSFLLPVDSIRIKAFVSKAIWGCYCDREEGGVSRKLPMRRINFCIFLKRSVFLSPHDPSLPLPWLWCQILVPYVKDLKASNVQDTNEVLSGLLGIQLLVDANNHPQEHLLIDSFCQGTNCIVHLKWRRQDWSYLPGSKKNAQVLFQAMYFQPPDFTCSTVWPLVTNSFPTLTRG